MKHPSYVLTMMICAGFSLAMIGCSGDGGGVDQSTQVGESTQSETDQGTSETTNETGTQSETGEPDPISYADPGAFEVGNLAMNLADPSGDRDLHVELWYPATGSATGAGQLIDFVPDEPDASSFAALVDLAPDECVRKQTNAAPGAELAEVAGPWPTLVFSHCHGCARFSSFTLAEHLASHGFLVAAVDHPGSTVFDQDQLPPINAATLELRRDDVMRVIDELLDPAATSLPDAFVGLADAERLGVFGHSFGSVTTGKVLQDDPRPRAGVAIAAPIESPLLPGVTMAGITEPLLMFVAVEDNSITALGNNLIRQNFSAANSPTWKLEFADTGHFGFSDLAGLSDYFTAGCGDGMRQTDGEAFVYADPFEVRALAAGRIAAFFALHLLGDEDALAQLEAADPLLTDVQAK